MVQRRKKKLEKQKLAVFQQHGPEGKAARSKGLCISVVSKVLCVNTGLPCTAGQRVDCTKVPSQGGERGLTSSHLLDHTPQCQEKAPFSNFSTALPR